MVESMYFEYKIPAGYQVESLPKPVILKFPDNSFSFTYSIQSAENKIVLLCKRNINRIVFLSEEYQNLKELYNQIVKKNTEQVILKKAVL
jgi:hypothetical protein